MQNISNASAHKLIIAMDMVIMIAIWTSVIYPLFRIKQPMLVTTVTPKGTRLISMQKEQTLLSVRGSMLGQ